MATATKSKPKPRTKPHRVKKASAKDVSGETEPVKWCKSVVSLGVKSIDRHPHNRHPAQASIDETAESIEQHGQLEPCLVRRVGRRYQLISGETRWLAQQQLGSKFVDARLSVDDISDAKALELVAAANGARNDLDPIQRAELLQQLCLPIEDGGSGLTQVEAGKLMGCGDEKKAMSRSSVANAIRMLKLPPKIRKVVASGELPETYARELLPLFETGFVTELAVKEILGELNSSQTDGLPNRVDFVDYVQNRIDTKTRPMDYSKPKVGDWYLTRPLQAHNAFFKTSDEQYVELQVVDVGGQPRATNIKLWEKLQKEAADAIINGKGKKKSESKAKAKKLTPAQQKAKDTKQAKQQAKRVADWTQLWKRWWMSHEIEAEAAFRIVISLECSSSNSDLSKIMSAVAEQDGLEIPSRLHQHHTIADVMQCTLDIETMIRRMAQVILWPKDRAELPNIWRRELIDDTASDLGFDVNDAWCALLDSGNDDAIGLLAEFYAIFSKDMLSDLKTGVVAVSPELEDARTKAQLVTALSTSFVAMPPVLKPNKKKEGKA